MRSLGKNLFVDIIFVNALKWKLKDRKMVKVNLNRTLFKFENCTIDLILSQIHVIASIFKVVDYDVRASQPILPLTECS
jgi:glutamate formiminotransferase